MSAVDEPALVQRAAGVGARVVQREDLLALPHQHELVDPQLGLHEPALGDRAVRLGLRGLERDPLRAGAAERMAADHVAEHVHDVAADVRRGREHEERQRSTSRSPAVDARPRPLPEADHERDEVHARG